MKWSDFLIKPTKYSNFDISTTKRFSASYGILYPVWWRVMNPGETFSINIRNLVRTNPVKSPLMGRFKMRTVTVVSNFKNYAVGLEGYRRSFDWRSFALPNICYQYDKVEDNILDGTSNPWRYGVATEGTTYFFSKLPMLQVKETSLMDYLGYGVGWIPTKQQYGDDNSPYVYKSFLSHLVYYDYYRNYMVNPQEGYFPHFVSRLEEAVIAPDETGNNQYNVGSKYYTPASYVQMKAISDVDKMFEDVHKYYDGSRNIYDGGITTALSSYFNTGTSLVYQNSLASLLNPTANARVNDSASYHGGLCATMFDPDINTQWLSVANYQRLNEVKVNTQSESGSTFTSFGDIVKASSLWDFVSREIYNGGTYADHIYSQFGVSVRSDMNIPQIVHVYDNMIDFEDITSQSDTSKYGPDNPLGAKVGQQFGVGRGYGQSSRFKIRNLDNNYCIAMTFMWITPLVDYSQGLNEELNLLQFSDLYTPAFDNYAMQPRLQEQFFANPFVDNYGKVETGDYKPWSIVSAYSAPADLVVGYQPAYVGYKTDVNHLHGLFSKQLSYWAIVRKTQYNLPGSSNLSSPLSSYVWSTPVGTTKEAYKAVNCEVPFSIIDEDNFFVQMRFDIMATRPMSKSVMPHVK